MSSTVVMIGAFNLQDWTKRVSNQFYATITIAFLCLIAVFAFDEIILCFTEIEKVEKLRASRGLLASPRFGLLNLFNIFLAGSFLASIINTVVAIGIASIGYRYRLSIPVKVKKIQDQVVENNTTPKIKSPSIRPLLPPSDSKDLVPVTTTSTTTVKRKIPNIITIKKKNDNVENLSKKKGQEVEHLESNDFAIWCLLFELLCYIILQLIFEICIAIGCPPIRAKLSPIFDNVVPWIKPIIDWFTIKKI